MARNTDVLNQLNNLSDNLLSNMDSLLGLPLTNLTKALNKSYENVSQKIKDFGENKGDKKLLSKILEGQKEQTQELVSGFNDGELSQNFNEYIKQQTLNFKSNSDLLKQISETNKSNKVIGDNVETGLDSLLDEFRDSNSNSRDNLDSQRKSFENLQNQLVLSSLADNDLIKQLINIDSKSLSFSEDSQKSMAEIFNAIKSDLNSEKLNTTLVNIQSSLESINNREDKILQDNREREIADRLRDKQRREQDEKEEKGKKDTGLINNVLSVLGSLSGLGGALSFSVSAFGWIVKSGLNLIKALPSLTTSLFSKLGGLTSSTFSVLGKGFDFLKNAGSTGLDLGKKGIDLTKAFGSNLLNGAKTMGGKALELGKGLGSKIGMAGAKTLGLGAVGAGALYDAGKGFEKTEQIMGKEGQEFGVLDIINAGGVNALTMGGLLGDPAKVQQTISGGFDSFMKPSTQVEPMLPKTNKDKASQGNLSMLGKPLKNMPVSSGFGMRIHPITGKRKFHNGTDLAVASGTPIYAPFDGKVIFAGSAGTAGNLTEIIHSGGLKTRYMHQSSIGVKQGDMVKVGQNIGAVGNTGASKGAHLHWETWLNGQPVNPAGINYSYKPSATQSVGKSMTKGKGGIGGDNFTQEELNTMSGNYSFSSSMDNLSSLTSSAINSMPSNDNVSGNIKNSLKSLSGSLFDVLPQEQINSVLNKIPDLKSILNNVSSNIPTDLDSLVDNTINQIPYVGNSISSFLNEFPELKQLGSRLIDNIPMVKDLAKYIPTDISSLISQVTSFIPKDISSFLSNPNMIADGISGLKSVLPKNISDLIPSDLSSKVTGLIGQAKGFYDNVPNFIKEQLPTSIDNIPSFLENSVKSVFSVMDNPSKLIDIGAKYLPELLNNPMAQEMINNGKSMVNSLVENISQSNPMVSDIINSFSKPNTQGVTPVQSLSGISMDLLKQSPFVSAQSNNVVQPPQQIIIPPSKSEAPKTVKSYNIDDYFLAVVTSGILD